MAHQPPSHLLAWIGFLVWGDIGALTLYKNKKKKLVAFSKTWPKKPASPEQQTLRDAFRAAAQAWQALTPAQRDQWELATKRTNLCMHGYDLFVHHQLEQDDEAIRTVARQSHTVLLPP